MEKRHLVLLEQVQDAVVVLFDHGVLAAEHLGHVDAQIRQPDAVVGEAVARMLEMLARLQQCFRRDAADVGAGAAGRWATLVVFPLIDAGGVEAELRGPDRGHVAARAAADDDDIKLLGHWCLTRIENYRQLVKQAKKSPKTTVTNPRLKTDV